MPNQSIVNGGVLYVNGMRCIYENPSNIGVGGGQCRDSTNSMDIVFEGTVQANIGRVGAGGVDQGVISASNFVYVYAIADSTKYKEPSVVLSKSMAGPLLPAGYDAYRRVGSMKIDGGGFVYSFVQLGNQSNRTFFYPQPVQIANLGAVVPPSTYTKIPVNSGGGNLTPSEDCEVILEINLEPSAPGSPAPGKNVYVQAPGFEVSNSAWYLARFGSFSAINGQVRAVARRDLVSEDFTSIYYRVDGTGALGPAGMQINLVGYVDRV